MLNYIWAGLVIFSLAFALTNDVRDLLRDTYRNGQSLPVRIEPAGSGGGKQVSVHIDADAYRKHYGVDETPAASIPADLIETKEGRELKFDAKTNLPPMLAGIRDATSTGGPKGLFKDAEIKPLQAYITKYEPTDAGGAVATVEIRFPAVRWVKVQAIGNAAMNFAATAIELSLGLIGTLCLFLGVMQIAEKAGIINAVVRVTGPILRPLFPGIPKGHPAMGMVTLNLTANMLGLGNAATPFGIKAMEELQKLNKSADTATNEMVMLLAMNTAGVQLLPPIFLYAVMGLRASELYIPIVIVTGLCLVIAISAVKLLGKLPGYRASDPDLLPEPGIANVVTAEVAT
jgi:spore maturation protein A